MQDASLTVWRVPDHCKSVRNHKNIPTTLERRMDDIAITRQPSLKIWGYPPSQSPVSRCMVGQFNCRELGLSREPTSPRKPRPTAAAAAF
jgi:hypothetical protein